MLYYNPLSINGGYLNRHAEVAQLVEHLTENQRVPSSSLGLGTLPILGDRLMVGQRPLEPYIQVRILVSQCNH